MSIYAVSFKQAELEVKNIEKKTVQPKVEIKEDADTVEISSKKEKPVRSFWGSVGALFLGNLVTLGGKQAVGSAIFPWFKKVGTFEGNDAETVINAVKQTHVDSGLKGKSVKLRFLDPIKSKNNRIYHVAGTGKKKFGMNMLKDIVDFMTVVQVRQGNNAFFVPKDIKLPKITFKEFMQLKDNKKLLKQKMKETATYIKGNSVNLPGSKLQSAGFHELGHAMNYNLSKFGKALQKCRPIALLVPGLIATYGAVTRASKPKEEGKELNAGQKTHNFVRDNAGKLAFLASTPMLLEEGMATIKGQKFAKKLLSPELAKKVMKGNAIAYLSYLSAGILGALAARTAVAVKDGAINKKEAKRAEKAEKEQEKVEKKEEEIQSLKTLDSK